MSVAVFANSYIFVKVSYAHFITLLMQPSIALICDWIIALVLASVVLASFIFRLFKANIVLPNL
jgi:hypothetical protein